MKSRTINCLVLCLLSMTAWACSSPNDIQTSVAKVADAPSQQATRLELEAELTSLVGKSVDLRWHCRDMSACAAKVRELAEQLKALSSIRTFYISDSVPSGYEAIGAVLNINEPVVTIMEKMTSINDNLDLSRRLRGRLGSSDSFYLIFQDESDYTQMSDLAAKAPGPLSIVKQSGLANTVVLMREGPSSFYNDQSLWLNVNDSDETLLAVLRQETARRQRQLEVNTAAAAILGVKTFFGSSGVCSLADLERIQTLAPQIAVILRSHPAIKEVNFYASNRVYSSKVFKASDWDSTPSNPQYRLFIDADAQISDIEAAAQQPPLR